jgi:hypothetical protein
MIPLHEIEEKIRRGLLQEAASAVSKIEISKVQRTQAARIANLARRAGLATTAIRVLGPIVRPEIPRARPATNLEKAEYAIAISRIGAHVEALKILKTISKDEEPETLLYEALCHFIDWNYSDSIPLLLNYSNEHSDPYQRLVGQVNLAAALVFEDRYAESEKLLKSVLKMTKSLNLIRLHGNANELMAQVLIGKQDFAGARSHIHTASLILGESLDLFYVKKWETLITAIETNDLKPLKRVRSQALQRGHWETVRDSDFYIAKIGNNIPLFQKIYFGTAAPGFRRRITNHVGDENIPVSYNWSPTEKRPVLLFDLQSGEVGKIGLRPGFALHRLLCALAGDFYRPFAPATLFGLVYPDEYFSLSRSPLRIQQLVFRLRDWAATHKVPVEITETGGLYRLTVNDTLGYIKVKDRSLSLPLDLRLQKVRKVFGSDTFTLKQFQLELQISKSQSIRLIQSACEQGIVRSLPRGYRFENIRSPA